MFIKLYNFTYLSFYVIYSSSVKLILLHSQLLVALVTNFIDKLDKHLFKFKNVASQAVLYSGFSLRGTNLCKLRESYCELSNFNSVVTLALLFQLTAHVTVLCLWFLYPIQTLQKSGQFCFATWPKTPKDCGGYVHHDDTAALLQCNLPKHPGRHGILWSQCLFTYLLVSMYYLGSIQPLI